VLRDSPGVRLSSAHRVLTRTFLGCVVLALCILAESATWARPLVVESLDEPMSLAGTWRFQIGDDPAWADPAYDDSGWAELQVPGGWGSQGYAAHSGVAWYRLDVDLSRTLSKGRADLNLGVQLGEVTSSYALYAGGDRLGGVGALPPMPRMEYDRSRIYALPTASIDDAGHVVLAIRVWKSEISRPQEGGPTRGPFLIGGLEDLNTRSLLSAIPYLVLVAVFGLVGLYHLRLFSEHRRLVEHFWFGLFALDVAAYTLLRTQWKYNLTDDFLLLKNLEYVAIYLLPPLGIQLTASLFSRPISRWLRAYQLSFLALAALSGLTPGLRFNILTLGFGQIWLLPTIAYAGTLGFQEYRRGHPQAKLLPSAFFLATCLFDLAVDHDWVRGPRMLPVGMTVMIFSMAATLANRLIRTGLELESLTETLEARVREQTSQLRERTEQLEQKNRELQEAQGSLRLASLTDPLTGLGNRRFVEEYLVHDVARVLREYAHAAADDRAPERTDLVFLLLDLDHFKQVNDRHGHEAGDRVLAQAAAILREVCRKSDFIVRWGGEEFLVISRFVDRRGAAALAERIRSEFARHSFEVGGSAPLEQTCSIGFASFPLVEESPDAHGWEDVLSVADRMLYAAKEVGRNCWAGMSGAAGHPDRGLAQRITEDLPGCLSRGELQYQSSRLADEDEAVIEEKDSTA